MCQKFDMLIKLMINFLLEMWLGLLTFYFRSLKGSQKILLGSSLEHLIERLPKIYSNLFVFPKLTHISRIKDVWIHGKFWDNILLPQLKGNNHVLLLHSFANQ